MNKEYYIAAASAAFFVGAVPAFAASVIIDTFDTPQAVADLPDGLTTELERAAPEAIGAYRELAVDSDGRVPGTLGNRNTTLEAVDGVLTFNNVDSATGRGWVTYDGVDGSTSPTVISTNGLGGTNLLLGSTDMTGFLFDIVTVDQPGLYIEIRAWDNLDANQTPDAVYGELLPAGGGNPFVPLSLFKGTIDWTRIGALQFFAQTGGAGFIEGGTLVPSLDGSISKISVEVIPLPASALLLLGGLGGLGAMRLRRRQG